MLHTLSTCRTVILLGICVCIAVPVFGRPVAVSSEGLLSFSPPSLYLQPSISSEGTGFESDGYHIYGDVRVKMSRQAVMNKTHLWPGGKVPYILDTFYSSEVRATIEGAMREIEQSVGSSGNPCVQFVPRTTEINYLDVRNGNSCSSVIGLDYTGPQVSTFAVQCALKGVIMHELLHTLGLYHEQDRYDRDSYITINTTNMRDDAVRDYIIKNIGDIDLLGTPYDFGSIMHYGPYNFAKDQRWPVMTPKPQYGNGTWMGQRYALSTLDVLRIQRLYKCPENVSHILSDISEDKKLAWCDFQNGICDLLIQVNSSQGPKDSNVTGSDESSAEHTPKVLWTVTSNATPDGPQAGDTNGIDGFFYASSEYSELVSQRKSNFNDISTISDTLNDGSSTPANTTSGSVTSDSPTDSNTRANNRTVTDDIPNNSTSRAPHTPTTSTSTPNSTVTLATSVLTTDTDSICIDCHIFQPGPSSYLQMYIMGPLFPRIQLLSLQGIQRNHWATVRQTLRLPPGVKFQFEIVAVLNTGSVALDDVHILKGPCL